MFSYELFLFMGACAALIGPKEMPIYGRVLGKYAGRAVGYFNVTRVQVDSAINQTQAKQVHKELQETMAQLEAIRHEIRSVSFMNPGSLSTRIVDNLNKIPRENVEQTPEEEIKETKLAETNPKAHNLASPNMHSQPATNAKLANSLKDQSVTSTSSDVHSQATTFSRLAEATKANSALEHSKMLNENVDASGNVVVLPISAESAELLPQRKGDVKGSDIVLEALLEAEVAKNAKLYFSQSNS